jgi:hypothetical protein
VYAIRKDLFRLHNLLILRKDKIKLRKGDFKLITKSPLGRILGGAVLILALSPKAREVARIYAIKATEMVLELTDQLRETTAGMKNQLNLGNEDIVIKDDSKKKELDTMNMGEH